MKKIVITCLILFIGINSFAQKENNKFEIGSDALEFTSKINNKNYKLYINLPASYSTDSLKNYPVLYKLDAQWSFASIVSLYGNLRFDGYVPEMIIVGISYGGINPHYDKLRGEDLTPTEFTYIPGSGGAARFQNVIRDEIMPLINKKYRTNTEQQTLSGTSLGGLFAYYTLLTANDLFNAYIICNPSFWWEEGNYIFKLLIFEIILFVNFLLLCIL